MVWSENVDVIVKKFAYFAESKGLILTYFFFFLFLDPFKVHFSIAVRIQYLSIPLEQSIFFSFQLWCSNSEKELTKSHHPFFLLSMLYTGYSIAYFSSGQKGLHIVVPNFQRYHYVYVACNCNERLLLIVKNFT